MDTWIAITDAYLSSSRQSVNSAMNASWIDPSSIRESIAVKALEYPYSTNRMR